VFTEFDPEIYALNQLGICHQIQSLELGEPEGFASPSTLRAVATHFDNKFEGTPVPSSSNRQILTELKSLCHERSLAAFGLDPGAWSVAIQALPIDALIGTALLPANGRVIGLRGPWQSRDLAVDGRTSRIAMDALSRLARDFRPHLIVAGAAGYPRNVDYAAFRRIADASSAVLVADLAQTGALVSAGIAPSPFEHCDVVVATVQRAMAPFRSDLVFYRKGNLGRRIAAALHDDATIPQTAAVAVAMKEASGPEFKKFQYAIVTNMKKLAGYLVAHGLPLVTGGTDHHIAQVDVGGHAADCESLRWVLDCANMTTTVGARGLTIGSHALTERGLSEGDFDQVGGFLVTGAKLASQLRKKHPGKTFRAAAIREPAVAALKKSVIGFARQFPLPGAEACR
jgi:glycine hydroxymethyltransferase